jgi:transposase
MLEESGTTKRCHACGSMEEFDRRELTHTCSTCSLLWDQDYNAAMNMLTTDVSDEPTANAEVKYVGRFAKRKAEQLSKGDLRAEMG